MDNEAIYLVGGFFLISGVVLMLMTNGAVHSVYEKIRSRSKRLQYGILSVLVSFPFLYTLLERVL